MDSASLSSYAAKLRALPGDSYPVFDVCHVILCCLAVRYVNNDWLKIVMTNPKYDNNPFELFYTSFYSSRKETGCSQSFQILRKARLRVERESLSQLWGRRRRREGSGEKIQMKMRGRQSRWRRRG